MLADEDDDYCLKVQFRHVVQSYPIDVTKVAKTHKDSLPARGADPAAPPKRQSTCPGCNRNRARNDWEHTREKGQCSYPYDDPWIPECIACQHREPITHVDHTFDEGCKYGQPELPRQRRRSDQPHEPKPKAHTEPTMRQPAQVEGHELGQAAEEQMAQAEAKRPRESRQAAAGSASSSSAGGSRQAEARIPHGARIAVVTTRRAQPAADALGGCVFGKYLLHDMLASVTAPLHEL